MENSYQHILQINVSGSNSHDFQTTISNFDGEIENSLSFCNTGHFSKLSHILPFLLRSKHGLGAIQSGPKNNIIDY